MPRLLAALSLALPLLSAAQQSALTDAERARRDADKVLSFIKFQTVRSKPAEPADKPRKPAAPVPPRATAAARASDAAPSAEPAAAEHAHALATPQPTATPAAAAATVEQTAAGFAAMAAPAPPTAPAEPEPEPEEHDEAPLQIQQFVAPVLPPSVQATLVGGSRKVTVRFTVEPNGTVSKAEAAADVPRRLARPATDAVLQWQFAPLAQARTVDVELAFRRE